MGDLWKFFSQWLDARRIRAAEKAEEREAQRIASLRQELASLRGKKQAMILAGEAYISEWQNTLARIAEIEFLLGETALPLLSWKELPQPDFSRSAFSSHTPMGVE